MKRMCRFIALVIIAAVLCGCHKKGEPEAMDIAKAWIGNEEGRVLSYEVKEDADIARLELMKKKTDGTVITQYLYLDLKTDKQSNKLKLKKICFAQKNNKFYNTLWEQYPKEFKKIRRQYNDLQDLYHEYREVVSEYEREYYDPLNAPQNFYFWREASIASEQVNDKIEEYESLYYSVHKEVQKRFDTPCGYFLVEYEGNVYGFDCNAQRTSLKPKYERW